MKRCFVFALVLVLLALGGCGESKEWQRFESEEGQFSILFPGKPEQNTSLTPTLEGDIETKSFIAEQGGVDYSVFFEDYPLYIIESDPAALLDEAIRTYVDSINARARMKKEITLDGYPGREFRFETLEEGMIVIIRARYYLVENRVYVLAALSSAPDSYSPEIDMFMDSFELER